MISSGADGRYLLELREAHRLRGSLLSTGRKIRVGDIVVVHSDEKRRGFWNLGKIEDTIVGVDGEIRGAVVRVFTGQKRSKLLKRPIQKLFPLEVNERDDLIPDSQDQYSTEEPPTEDVDFAEDDDINESIAPINNQESGPRRSKRAAAIAARDNILVQSMS